MRWVWIGGIVMFFGTLIAVIPNKREMKLVRGLSKEESPSAGDVRGYEVA